MKRAGIFLLGTLLLWGLLACSTTGRPLLESAAERGRRDSLEGSLEPDPYDPQEQDTGLEIRSNPRGAHVYMDNRYMGITPLLIEDVDTGQHKITLKMDGYYSESKWIGYSGDFESYYFSLVEITGFLKVEAFPPEAEINFGTTWLPAGRLHELAVGSYTLRVRAFGYRETRLPVDIYEREVTELIVSLEQAAFAVSGLQSNRTVFNPRNAGLLGSARIRFRVSTYGSGRALVIDEQGSIVAESDLGRFTTWEQSFEWSGRAEHGIPLPDGAYTVRIEGVGEQAGQQDSAELGLLIDSSIVLLFRSLWSGSAGLLYAPATDILPGGSVQVSSLVLAHSSSGGGTTVLVPVNLGMRAGLGQRNIFELDASIGGIIGYSQDAFHMPWFATAAFKSSLLRPSGNFGLGSAVQAKLTYQSACTDMLANFSGLSVGLPTSLRWGSLSLLVCPEVILSPWTVVDIDEETPPVDLYGWLYGRFGLLLDLSPFSFGASLSLRCLPFDRGFALDLPFQSAVEAHWLIPKTQLFLSLAVAGQFESSDSFRLFGGAGLGVLN